MTIKEFLEKTKNTTNLKEILEIRTYIPITEKKAILETILDICYTVEGGVPTCDYVLKKIAFELAMIKYHTDLEIDITSEADYDSIQKSEIVFHNEYLSDYDECRSLFIGMEQELRAQYSIESSIASLTNKFSNSIEGLVSGISEKMKEFDVSKFGFEDLELDRFKNLLNKYGK